MEKVVELKTGMDPQKPHYPSHIDVPDGIHNFLNWEHPCNAFPWIDRENNRVMCRPKRKKVALVGYAAASRGLAPFDDPEYEIWGLNQVNRWIPRADRWFEIHQEWNTHVVEGTDYMDFMKTLPIPVYMSYPDPIIPNAIQYPKDALVKEFGIEYLTSTIAEMLALAIYEGFSTIGLYGIDLVVGDEWSYQKPCAEFWLGVAHAKGIAVRLPNSSALLKSRFSYGYRSNTEIPLATSKLRERLMKCQKEMQELQCKLDTLSGCEQTLRGIIGAQEIWENGGDTTLF